MNLLTYTKKLYEKINFYDKVFKNKNFDNYASNPFNNPKSLTVIWVEHNKK